jgi:phenylalanyl-tRNA synthetase beta chain
MRFTLSWLQEFLDSSASVEDITNTLTKIGLEVEEVVDYSKNLKDFTVAEIISAMPHPEADKLQICTINNGKEILQIICGAPNARAGIKVVLAPIGSVIPSNNLKIKLAKIRNIESCGMLCSYAELGIENEAAAGIIELPQQAVVGENFTKYCGLDEVVITLSITPNRGDCLGVYGIARDLAAAGIGSLKALREPVINQQFASPIKVEATELFVGYYVKNVQNQPSPPWLVNRLKAIGKKSISLLVDITNYINFSFARPLHIYDADQITGTMVVRNAHQHEKFLALNEATYELDESDVVIADEARVLALAGIIGGKIGACEMNSKNIFLEAANFDINTLTKSARKHKIETDSRYRFERGVDDNFTHLGAKLALEMILEFSKDAEVSKALIVGQEYQPPRMLDFNIDKLTTLGGISLSLARITEILLALGFKVKGDDKVLNLTIPSYRSDINIEADIVEEILRIYGYDNVPLTPLPNNDLVSSNAIDEKTKRINIIKRKLAAYGFNEVVNFSFIDEKKASLFAADVGNFPEAECVLVNPMSLELNYMRNSLIPSLLEVVRKNSYRKINNMAIFEVANIFSSQAQNLNISGMRAGKTAAKNIYASMRDYDFFDIKEDVALMMEELGMQFDNLQLKANALGYYHPKRSVSIYLGKNLIGYFGDLHPGVLEKFDLNVNVSAFEIFIDNMPLVKNNKKSFLKTSDYQMVARDFAFVVDRDFAAGELIKIISNVEKVLIKQVNLFDVYIGDKVENNKKSLAINVTLQADDRTLTDKEIEEVCQKIVNEANKVNAYLRG